MTKTDLYPEWRRIVELDRGHLAAAGVDADVLPVSSTLRWHAMRTQDKSSTPSRASPELIGFLRDRCSPRPTLLDRRSRAQTCSRSASSSRTTMQAELAARRTRSSAEALVAELKGQGAATGAEEPVGPLAASR